MSRKKNSSFKRLLSQGPESVLLVSLLHVVSTRLDACRVRVVIETLFPLQPNDQLVWQGRGAEG